MGENDEKKKAVERKGEMLDSMNISSGSAAKGTAVSLKTYYDINDIEDAQKKIENALKIRQFLQGKGIMQ